MAKKTKHLPQNIGSVSLMDKINLTTVNGRELIFTRVSFGKEPLQTGWQKKENGLDYSRVLWEVCKDTNTYTGPGLVHGLSGTMAFDIDDLEKTIEYFKNRFGDNGETLENILNTGFHIKSPSSNRDKVLFMVSDEQLQRFNAIKKNHVVKHSENGSVIFELRGAGGMDVFPPAQYLKIDYETETDIFYKKTGDYYFEGDSVVPMLPEILADLKVELLSKGQQNKATEQVKKQSLSATTANSFPAVIKEQEAVHLIRNDGTQSIVYVFNLTYPMDKTLGLCRYTLQSDKKWLSPNSISGVAGVILNQSTKNPWDVGFSNHAHDGQLYLEQHDAYDIAATYTYPDLSLDEAKKEFAKQQSKLLKAIDTATGNALNITVDEFNKQVLSKKQNSSKPAAKKFTPIMPISGAELEQMELPPIHFIVPGLIPAGRTLLVADPKKGKSWFVLYLIILIATGFPILGRKVTPKKTIYFPLEDNNGRINSRAGDIYRQFNIPQEAKNNWVYNLTLDRIGDGLEEAILDYMSRKPDTEFMVIDVLGKIRPVKESQGIYKADYAIGDVLKTITDAYPKLAILVVHHSNKGDKVDVVGIVSGSHGLAGGFDNIFGIIGDNLLVNGRDLESQDEIELVKNTDGQYTMAAPDITDGMSGTRKTVYDFIENNSSNNTLVSPKQIINGTGLSSDDVNQQLRKMLNTGLITKPQRGQYKV
ncbi:MAG: AAA family ATPase [Methylococcaceae bacterium]|nr:AAA family ATPase [Methylococcaceae bacterium]